MEQTHLDEYIAKYYNRLSKTPRKLKRSSLIFEEQTLKKEDIDFCDDCDMEVFEILTSQLTDTTTVSEDEDFLDY